MPTARTTKSVGSTGPRLPAARGRASLRETGWRLAGFCAMRGTSARHESETVSCGGEQSARVRLNQPDWSDHSHSVALTVELRQKKVLLHLILNGYWDRSILNCHWLGNGGGTPGAGGLIPVSKHRTTSCPGRRLRGGGSDLSG